MELKAVESGMLAAVGYDEQSGLLVVLFNSGRAYEYYGVPLAKYQGLMTADSKGTYMRAHIIGKYDYSPFRGWTRARQTSQGQVPEATRAKVPSTETRALPLVLLTHTLPPEWLTLLEGRVRIMMGPAAGVGLARELAEHLGEAAGLLTLLTVRVDGELLDRAPNLRVVSQMAVGYDNIDVPACTARGIPVGNTPGVLTDGTADLTMALLLAVARRLPEASEDARSGRWSTWTATGWLGADLHGATLGIVGMGKIGKAVAKRAHAFGLRLLYTDTRDQPDLDESLGAQRVGLEELLRASHFVSLHVPLTQDTRHLIGEEQLRSMRPDAIIVNTSRGPVIDMEALYLALAERRIAGAGLDVTEPEPLPPDHPLYSLDNCLILPHIGSATRGTRRRMAELACENLLAGLAGERLPNCVNPEVYQARREGNTVK